MHLNTFQTLNTHFIYLSFENLFPTSW